MSQFDQLCFGTENMFERKEITSSNVSVCNMFLAKKHQNIPKKGRIQQTTMNLFVSIF